MKKSLLSIVLLRLVFTANAAIISFDNSDFVETAIYSNVVTYNYMFDVNALSPGDLRHDPHLSNIQYGINGTLAAGTPSGFPAFAFQLDHIFPLSPPITGAEFYGLNGGSVAGQTLRFEVSITADIISDGLQLSELVGMNGLGDVTYLTAGTGSPTAIASGDNVIFQFNGRETGETGVGRYHPSFIRLYGDGTGIIFNANNSGGVNPATMDVVDVAFGEEYVTELSFTASDVTIASSLAAAPEPSSFILMVLSMGFFMVRRNRS